MVLCSGDRLGKAMAQIATSPSAINAGEGPGLHQPPSERPGIPVQSVPGDGVVVGCHTVGAAAWCRPDTGYDISHELSVAMIPWLSWTYRYRSKCLA